MPLGGHKNQLLRSCTCCTAMLNKRNKEEFTGTLFIYKIYDCQWPITFNECIKQKQWLTNTMTRTKLTSSLFHK